MIRQIIRRLYILGSDFHCTTVKSTGKAQKIKCLTEVGFEPTPFRNTTWTYRLRPLGHSAILTLYIVFICYYRFLKSGLRLSEKSSFRQKSDRTGQVWMNHFGSTVQISPLHILRSVCVIFIVSFLWFAKWLSSKFQLVSLIVFCLSESRLIDRPIDILNEFL